MDRVEILGSFVDGTGTRLENPPHAVMAAANGVVFNSQGEVLLQRRADNGWWALPGGKVDIGESVSEAAAREVWEETGLCVKPRRLVGIYSDPQQYNIMTYPDGVSIQYVTVLFECEVTSGKLKSSAESTEVAYFPVDQLPRNTMLSHLLRIEDAVASRTEPFLR